MVSRITDHFIMARKSLAILVLALVSETAGTGFLTEFLAQLRLLPHWIGALSDIENQKHDKNIIKSSYFTQRVNKTWAESQS